MSPVITVFKWSPDGGKGQARDMRVRWAMEEVGQPYDVRLVSFKEMKLPEHRARQPFGQIPAYEEDGLVLFESGAIVLHIAQKHPGLLAGDATARARAIAWMFAAVSTMEPPVVDIEMAEYTESGYPWYQERLPIIEARAEGRLGELANSLGGAEWLDGDFSAGDLMMVTVLRRLDRAGLAEKFPILAAYAARGEARPAFKRAYDAQAKLYSGEPPEEW